MKTHELKTWPEPYAAVKRGEKLHEVRVDDRNYQPGDRVTLREWNPSSERYTGDMRCATIGHVTRGPDWGLPHGICVFALLDVEAAR